MESRYEYHRHLVLPDLNWSGHRVSQVRRHLYISGLPACISLKPNLAMMRNDVLQRALRFCSQLACRLLPNILPCRAASLLPIGGNPWLCSLSPSRFHLINIHGLLDMPAQIKKRANTYTYAYTRAHTHKRREESKQRHQAPGKDAAARGTCTGSTLGLRHLRLNTRHTRELAERFGLPVSSRLRSRAKRVQGLELGTHKPALSGSAGRQSRSFEPRQSAEIQGLGR